jgi:hypothetical protein
MAGESAPHDPAEADLYQAAEAAIQSGRAQHVRFKGTALTIGLSISHKRRTPRGAEQLTPAEREEILRASFGTWKGHIDGGQLKRDLRELQRDDANPRSL